MTTATEGPPIAHSAAYLGWKETGDLTLRQAMSGVMEMYRQHQQRLALLAERLAVLRMEAEEIALAMGDDNILGDDYRLQVRRPYSYTQYRKDDLEAKLLELAQAGRLPADVLDEIRGTAHTVDKAGTLAITLY